MNVARLFVPTVKSSDDSVVIWGCFGCTTTGDLVKIDGIVRKENFDKYWKKMV